MRMKFIAPALTSSALALSAFAGGLGTDYCFGVGCPCGNDDPLAGCATSTGSGASLEAFGSTSVSENLLGFEATNVPQNKVGLLVMGSVAVNEPLRDGLRCFGGTIQRFWKHKNSGQSGVLRYESVISDWAEVSNVHLTAGDTRFFQVWFRDSGNGSPCGLKANLTHGVELTFTP